MKISVSSYSYGNVKNFSLIDRIEHAKKTGYDGMEFLHGYQIDDYSIKDTAKILGDKCRELGLEVFSYDGGVDFLRVVLVLLENGAQGLCPRDRV